MANLIFSGKVLDEATKKGLAGITLKLNLSGKSYTAETDADGKYNFENLPEPNATEDQQFELTVYGNYIDNHQYESKSIKDVITKGSEKHYEIIELTNRGPISNSAGLGFLSVLVIILLAVVGWYYHLHQEDKPEVVKGKNSKIVNTLSESLVDRITADLITIESIDFKAASKKDSNYISNELKQIELGIEELLKVTVLDASIETMIEGNLLNLKTNVDSFDKEGILTALEYTKKNVVAIPELRPDWFWENYPGLYFEIIFWAFITTLLRLIGNTSYYYSRNNFLRDTIPHKAVLLVTIPLIALLITMIISFFKISIAIGDGDPVTANFSNPYLTIIVAALIGLAPWRSWEFMYGVADLLFNSLKNWLRIPKKDEKKNVAKKNDNEKDKTGN